MQYRRLLGCQAHGLVLKPRLMVQRERQEQIEEKKALKREEREMARRHEFVRRCRIAVEEKRQKVCCTYAAPRAAYAVLSLSSSADWCLNMRETLSCSQRGSWSLSRHVWLCACSDSSVG